ncbi:CACTA en-spm transposon protein [Cucumis melo var. makuwa]|uniref:CACTA en-spm transposon protein n=1 Tax=Cucumis melo var. makuwa TaxID=1194695 RepID=A0A5D3E0Q5_CUCMM|nr:CACTA en-spm transposon protein [Cucumis melo var. makuwa]
MADMYSRCHASCIGTTSGIRTIPNAVVVRQEWRRIPDVERAQSRLLKLECYVAANWFISMTIGPSTEKLIFLYVVRFNQAIGVCVRKTFLVRCLKWADVGREYIEVVKANLQRFFVLDFNDQAMNRLVEHQMLSTFKEFWGDCHRHFKKYSDHEETRVNPPNILVLGRQPGYSKGLGWRPKPKARKMRTASSSSMSCSQSTEREIQLQAKLDKALEQIEWIEE